jgi:hypothetical protein
MSDTNLEAQTKEIAAVCKQLGIDRDTLADRIAISRETMRKWAGGYQKASESSMQSIRNLLRMKQFFLREDSVNYSPAAGTPDARRFGMLLTDEEREGLMYMVRDKTDAEVISQITETLNNKTLTAAAKFSAVRFWLEVLERREEQK